MKNRFAYALIILLAVPGLLKAQHCDSLDIHLAGWYYLYPHELLQTSQGDYLIRSTLFELDENGLLPPNYTPDPTGNVLYNITSDGLMVSDSVLTLSIDKSFHLWATLFPNNNIPQQYRNVDACIVWNGETSESSLNISFFNDSLNYNDDLNVSVHLADTFVFARHEGGWLLDCNNDIILQYCIPSRHETHFTRFGIDGTLKHEKVFSENVIPVDPNIDDGRWNPQGLYQVSDNPSIYAFYGRYTYGSAFIGLVLDSVFNVMDRYRLVDQYGNYPSTTINGGVNGMVVLEDECVLVVRNMKKPDGTNYTGIVKYDKNCHPKGDVWFSPFDKSRKCFCGGLIQDTHGCLYLSLYRGWGHSDPQLAIIKLDSNLNIIWERFGMSNMDVVFPMRMILLDQGGVALIGQRFTDSYTTEQTGLFLMVIEDNYLETKEIQTVFKPYAFFPNPVVDQLHLEFSPDVQPRTVELYDIQGRLVRSQGKGFESIRMSNLPSGTYTLRIVMEDETSYSDKVVKQ